MDALDGRQTITSFAGLRAHLVHEEPAEKSDFLIGEAEGHPGFIDVAGIESPGLTSAPAIGEYVARIVNNIYPAERKTDFIDSRKGIPDMALATEEEREALIRENPAFANVICRCGGDGRRDSGSDSPPSRSNDTGWCQTPYQSRYGQMSGGLLFPEDVGNPVERTASRSGTDH